MTDLTASIHERYVQVLDRIAAAANKARRAPESVRVVVVTKTQPSHMIEAAIEAGARLLGENYAEEAAGKIGAMPARADVEWHMIGHVQSRKAHLVAQHFALVHSLDSLKLAQRLDREAAALGHRLPVLLEVNVSGEESKYGMPAANEALWADLPPLAEAISNLQNLKVLGLMTMPPITTDPEAARIYFRLLRSLRDFLAGHVARIEWSELSMGTSADYQVAVEEGATLVRIGQAILGPRSEKEVR
jgi:hypothetical protein